VYLLLATLVLLVRSIFEFALTIRAWSPNATRQSLQSTRDVGYGIITILYLGFMYATARVVSSGFDRGGKQARLVESDVRFAILRRLQQETEEGRRESPPFLTILDQVGNDLEAILRDGQPMRHLRIGVSIHRFASVCGMDDSIAFDARESV
jgi:hypothetical protein